MPGLTTPFNYRDILIGEEIMYRSLVQQENFARQGKYNQEWNERDQIDKSAAYFNSNVLRADFAIPAEYQHCIPEPPCPWDKQQDKVELSQIKPVITGADGVYSYAMAVYQRIDGTNSYRAGNKVIDFVNDQSQLDTKVRGEFNYFGANPQSQYLGPALFVVERFHRGVKDREYHYVFDLIS